MGTNISAEFSTVLALLKTLFKIQKTGQIIFFEYLLQNYQNFFGKTFFGVKMIGLKHCALKY